MRKNPHLDHIENFDMRNYRNQLKYDRIEARSASCSSEEDKHIEEKKKISKDLDKNTIITDDQIFAYHLDAVDNIGKKKRGNSKGKKLDFENRKKMWVRAKQARRSLFLANKSKMKLKKIGKTLMKFVQFMKVHKLSVMDIIRCPLFIRPHLFGNLSKRFFTAVKTGGYREVKRMCMKEKMIVFQIDTVRDFLLFLTFLSN